MNDTNNNTVDPKAVNEGTKALKEQANALDVILKALSMGRGMLEDVENASGFEKFANIVSSADFEKFIRDMAGLGPTLDKFNESVEKGVTDFFENAENLTLDDLKKSVDDLFSGAGDGLKDAIKWLEKFGVSGGQAEEVVQQILDAVGFTGDKLKGWLDGINPHLFDAVVDGLFNAQDYLSNFESYWTDFFADIDSKTLEERWAGVAGALETVGDALSTAKDKLDLMGLSSDETSGLFDNLTEMVDKATNIYERFNQVVKSDDVQALIGRYQEYAAQKEALDGEAAQKDKERFETRKKQLEEELAAAVGNEGKTNEIKQQMDELDAERRESRQEKVVEGFEIAMESMGAMNEVFNAFEDLKLERMEADNAKEKESLQKKLEDGLISQEEYDRQVTKLDENLEQEKAKIARKQAVREKAMSVFQIGLNTAMAIMKIWGEVPKFDFGVSTIALTAAVAAIGAVQMAAALAAPLPKARRGGYILGASHENGGVLIEAEGGEGIVNRAAMSAFPGMVSLMNAVGLNGGTIPDGGYGARASMRDSGLTLAAAGSPYPGAMDSEDFTSSIREAMIDAVSQVKVYTAIADIHDGENRFSQIEQYRQI